MGVTDNRILQQNWFLKKSGSGNRIYRNSMLCVQNQTQQLVGNDVFKHVSELCLFYMCRAIKSQGMLWLISVARSS